MERGRIATQLRKAIRCVAVGALFSVLSVGCGGGPGAVDTTSGAYQGAFQVCTNTPVKQHALELGVKADPDVVADAVAFAIAGERSGSDYKNGKQGCIDAYRAEK
jgi:hypothetical protein